MNIVKIMSQIKLSFSFLYKDKINLICFLIPLFVGILLFSFMGTMIFEQASLFSTRILSRYAIEGFWGSLLMGLVKGLVLVLVFMMFNWFFVLILSLIASPFNIIISKRVEKKFLGEKLNTLQDLWKDLSQNFIRSLFTEVKKITFLLLIGFLAFVLSFIPVLAPLTFLLLAMSLAWEFLDYSWSRYEWSWSKCFKDLMANFFSYNSLGFFFLLLSSIPLLNLLVPSWATSAFTLTWITHHENNNRLA